MNKHVYTHKARAKSEGQLVIKNGHSSVRSLSCKQIQTLQQYYDDRRKRFFHFM